MLANSGTILDPAPIINKQGDILGWEKNPAVKSIEDLVNADSVDRPRCAGILLRSPTNKYLLLQKGYLGGFQWETPGGHLEAGETPEQAAVRECKEETGVSLTGTRLTLSKTLNDTVEYTLYLQDVPEEFIPTLSPHEHIRFKWLSSDDLPYDIQPDLGRVIKTLNGNEYDVAMGVRDEILVSPQRFGNIWLFDLRITGTGMSYRIGDKQYVWRSPEAFLTPEFTARCNGLAVIFEHPEKIMLDSGEFRERIIGSVVLPYIKNEEVRGIAKIFDATAVPLMLTTHTSTSPTVRTDISERIIKEGAEVLIEGAPLYLDHVAVCDRGVWDKLEGPTGINIGDADMTTDTKVTQAEDVKGDSEGEKAPKWFADAMAPLCSRLDTLEAKNKADSESAAESATMDSQNDKADSEDEKDEKDKKEKADSEDEKDKKEKADSEDEKDKKEKADSQAQFNQEFKAMAAKVEALTRPLSDVERDELSAAQMKADKAYQLFGTSAPAPQAGEKSMAYRQRLANGLKSHSPSASKIDKMSEISGGTFDIIENQIYADAQTAATKVSLNASPGHLIAHVSTDDAGRRITSYTGDILSDGAFGPFQAPFRYGKPVMQRGQ